MSTKKSNPGDCSHTKLETKTRPDWTDDATQNFSELQYKCWTTGILFEDPEFPANESSLGVQNISHPIWWRRPVDIVDRPEFFSGDFSTFDVQPGDYGNRPLLCAVASLALHPNLFKLVVPENQNFYIRYAGIFRFKFWKYDRWVDVVIDDRLPSYNGQLVFLHSSGYQEFWSALLEKAYAKLHGSYGALRDSHATSVLTDLTGGVSEIYQLSPRLKTRDIEYLRNILVDAHRKKSIVVCTPNPQPTAINHNAPSEDEISLREGFYCITKIDAEVRYMDSPSLYLKNPWKYGDVLMDAGCEKSITPQNPGERFFSNIHDTWISMNDLSINSMQIEICHLPEDEQWIKSVAHGEWMRRRTAGGSREFLKSFCQNPQYCIEFNRPDEGKETCTFIVSLTQRSPSWVQYPNWQYFSIGFFIHRLESRNKRLNVQFIQVNISQASAEYNKRREVSLRVELPPGIYCIIPSTFLPNQEAEFMITVLSKTPCELKKIVEIFDRYGVRKSSVETEKWITSNILHGQWVREVSAGGCRTYLKTFCYNPQYCIEFNRPDEGKETRTFIVSLTQQHKNSQFFNIGFYIYRLKNHNKRLDMNFIRENVSAAKSMYSGRPEVTLNVALPPGTYYIIPSTIYPNQEAEFLIKVLSKTPCYLKQITDRFYVNRINDTVQRRIKYDNYDIKMIEREFFTYSTLLSIKRQKELPWTDFPMILNYTIKTVLTKKNPFLRLTFDNFITKNVDDAMISALERKYSGTQLSFRRFTKIWSKIERWGAAFLFFALHPEGVLGGFNFREALEMIGFKVNNLILEAIIQKYGTSNRQVKFENFILCAFQLYTSIH